jgi:DNA repair exonuclease SbcCD ATPase subunit
MADVSSLGEYKVVVTADYSQLKTQFKAMADYVTSTTKSMTDSVNKSMNALNATVVSQLQASVDQLKKAIEGLGDAPKKGGDGWKSYAQQIREAEKAAQKCHQEITALQNKMATSSMSPSDLARLNEMQTKFRELREQRDRLVQSQADYNMRIKETQNLEAMAARAKKQADQEGLRALQERERAQTRATQQEIRQSQQASAERQRQINALNVKYRVALEEVNKYLQTHAKMSEAVFIRLQGRLTAIHAQLQELRASNIAANPLGNMNYADYEKRFSRFSDMMNSLKHHMTWMASAVAMGTAIAIPTKLISTIAEVEKQMAQMKQVNEAVKDSQEVLNKTTQDYIGIAQEYGASVNEVIKAGVLWGRAYKDLNTVMKLTTLSTKLSVADNMDIGLANRAVESVINGYQKQGQAIQFATHVVDSWTKIAHNAQSSATDLAEALMRTGAAAKAVGVDFDTTNALASTMIKATGRSGAEVGRVIAA